MKYLLTTVIYNKVIKEHVVGNMTYDSLELAAETLNNLVKELTPSDVVKALQIVEVAPYATDPPAPSSPSVPRDPASQG